VNSCRIVAGRDNLKNGINRQAFSGPSSPQGPQGQQLNSFEVIGSAESLVGRVLASQGLGKYCDPDFVAKELSEALDMTRDQMDREAFMILNESAKSEQQKNAPSAPPRRLNKRQDDL
jgi:voltage-dependent calcium channel L type alpha-1D